MVNFNSKTLKEIFPSLERLSDSTLCPITDNLFNSWVKELPKGRITDIYQKYNLTQSFPKNKEYFLVVNQKIVGVETFMENILIGSVLESWYFVNDIHFYQKDNLHEFKQAFSQFSSFVEKQDLDAVVLKVSENLNKFDILNITAEMYDFYITLK